MLVATALAISRTLAVGSVQITAPEVPVPPPTLRTPGQAVVTGETTSGATSERKVLKIQSVERMTAPEGAKDVTWLGVFTEEISEPLSAQLDLKSGEGLLIIYVAEESPALKAGLEKNDVLVSLGDQLLVNAAQLAKLIRSQKEGDTIKLTLYRRGKKQTVSATLGKRTAQLSLWMETSPGDSIPVFQGGTLESLHGVLHPMGSDNQKVRLEVERSMEEARKNLEDALRQKRSTTLVSGPGAKDFEALARSTVNFGKDASVVVKTDGGTARTIVKADDTGTLVIVANPKKRLTVHDKDGKLLFDGEIETEAQQQKVPAELWEKVQLMLEQLAPTDPPTPKPSAEVAPGAPKS